MRVCEPLAESYELNRARSLPPCGAMTGCVPAVTIVHAPAVPATCAVAQPVMLSNPFEKSVDGALHVAVKLLPETFAPARVTERLAGENVQPLLVGVTVYVPLARPLMT